MLQAKLSKLMNEAILLADKIMLMSNGPEARIAEIVVNTLPKTHTRADIHHHPQFYKIRNHRVDFLVTRSKSMQQITINDPNAVVYPPEVMPDLEDDSPSPEKAPAPILKQIK